MTNKYNNNLLGTVKYMIKHATASTLDKEVDIRLNSYTVQLDKISNGLLKFGLTQNQAKTYIFLGKYGPQTAPTIFKSLKLPRTETYHLLNGLQKMGIVSATFDHPSKFIAMPFDAAIKILINSERERISEVEKEGKELEEVWNQVPDLSIGKVGTKAEDRFQMLQGQNQIINKMNELYGLTKNEFLVLGSEKDYVRFYHSDFLDSMKNSKIDTKLLTSCSKNTMYVFNELDLTRVKAIPAEVTESLCFVIKDGMEAVFFVKNNGNEAKDLLAVWTDSVSIIRSLMLLFRLLWSKTKTDDGLKQISLSSQPGTDYDFKLRELEQERLLISEIRKHFSKMISKKTVEN